MLATASAVASSTPDAGPALVEFVVPVKFRARNAEECRRALWNLPGTGGAVDAEGKPMDEPTYCRQLFPNLGKPVATDAQSSCAAHRQLQGDRGEIALSDGLTEAECRAFCQKPSRRGVPTEKCTWRSAEEVAQDDAADRAIDQSHLPRLLPVAAKVAPTADDRQPASGGATPLIEIRPDGTVPEKPDGE